MRPLWIAVVLFFLLYKADLCSYNTTISHNRLGSVLTQMKERRSRLGKSTQLMIFEDALIGKISSSF